MHVKYTHFCKRWPSRGLPRHGGRHGLRSAQEFLCTSGIWEGKKAREKVVESPAEMYKPNAGKPEVVVVTGRNVFEVV